MIFVLKSLISNIYGSYITLILNLFFYELHRKGIILVYFYLGVFKTDTLVVNFFHVSVAKNPIQKSITTRMAYLGCSGPRFGLPSMGHQGATAVLMPIRHAEKVKEVFCFTCTSLLGAKGRTEGIRGVKFLFLFKVE